jgi:hypothetical protein
VLRLKTTRKPPSCRTHDHLPPQRAEAKVESRLFEWVGQKRRAITPARHTTDCDYDRAPSLQPKMKRPPMGSCKFCGVGSVGAVCGRCRLDGITDGDNLVDTTNRWEHNLNRSNRITEVV